jgi:hypothetical protein
MRLNDIYSTQMRANDIVTCIFSRLNEKLPRNDPEMNGKISFVTVNDGYNPFSFAAYEQLAIRFSKTISSR